MVVVVGLGNPGKKYEKTRHNIGFQVVESIAESLSIKIWQTKFDAHIAEGRYNDEKFMLVKPQTFMNLSGNAVQQLLHFYKIPLDQLLVIVDDLDLDTGKIRTRERGSDGGHRGLRSIAERLGTQDFKRIRIGVGRPKTGESVIKRVLGSSNDPKEEEQLQTAVKQATEISEAFIASGKFENWSSNLG